ncbi:MAG: zf-HC2 domain-containing protein [Treponema sp.]
MSTCPSKDIHSIYLDNELPAAYVREYEAHIKVCPKCAAELAKLRAVHEILHSDALCVTPDSHYLEQSWNRLQSRMSYSKVTKKVLKFPAEQFKYIIPAAAAAVVLAVLLPVRAGRGPSETQTAQITPITRQKIIAFARNNIIINGNIRHEMLGPAASRQSQQHTGIVPAGTNTDYNGPFIQEPRTHETIDPQLNDVDVFRPDFGSNRTITIRITIPGITTPPLSTEIEFPAEELADTVK